MSSVKRISALKNPSASLIFLHGLGDTCDGWSGILGQEIHQTQGLEHINLVLPTAPVQWVSGFGDRSTSWFDIKAMGSRIGEGNDGFLDSVANIKKLVQTEIDRGIPANRIVVGGFSQGGALALGSAILMDTKMAGFISHSGFLTDQLNVEPQQKPVNSNTPLLMIQGKSDDVVQFPVAEASRKNILKFGFTDVAWKTYNGLPHSADVNTINDIKIFLKKTLC